MLSRIIDHMQALYLNRVSHVPKDFLNVTEACPGLHPRPRQRHSPGSETG
jgi:hypothetical protein